MLKFKNVNYLFEPYDYAPLQTRKMGTEKGFI